MARTRTKIAVILMSMLLCLAAATPVYATQRRAAPKPVAKAPESTPAIEVVQPPPQPLTLEQQPASPPRVSYQDGLLTIAAHNSTLGDILRSVHAQTGAAVDVPGNATERVVGHFGPGPAREVLAELLNGSHFNYVMLGSATNPDTLERVILTSRTGGLPETSSVAQVASRPVVSPPAPVEPQEEPLDANSDEDFSDDQVADQPAEEAQPDQNQDASQQQQEQQQLQQQGFPNAQPGVRSPEQLLRELQQRQLQQQGNPQVPPPGFPVPPNQQSQPPQ
ncbi:MAG: hypothetical protein LAN83_05855 [Acidobacteriia bacterium]|nr:hypothetical protein [Terriglobia bacterium]